MKLSLAVVVLLVFVCAGSAVATWNISKDPPLDDAETLLCGVPVSRNSVDLLTAKFGKPSQITDRPNTLRRHSRRDYEWDLGTIRLRVTTGAGSGFFTVDTYETIEVWGTKALGEIGATGRGLKLGASVSDVGRIYGFRFAHEPRPSRIKTISIAEPITITWSTGALEIYLDTNRKVNHIELTKLNP